MELRRTLICMMLVGLFAAALAAQAAEYYIVLQDGTWAPATGKPTIGGGKAYIPIRAGMFAVIDEKHVDWEASKRYTEAGEQPEGRHAVPGEGLAAEVTFTNVPHGALADLKAPAPAAASSAPAHPARSTPPPPPADSNREEQASLRARISTLDEGIRSLQGRTRDMELQMSREWNLDDKEKIRTETTKIEADIQKLRDEKEQLILKLWNAQQ